MAGFSSQTVPSWYVLPEYQLNRAQQLWPNTILPKTPKKFIPQTKSEVLLLHVPDTFDSLWNKVTAPKGYTKGGEGIKSDQANLRLAPNKRVFTRPVWLAFDPEHGKGECPEKFLGQPNLAASEVFSAMIQFPNWPLAWFASSSAPNLTGYQLRYGKDWAGVPFLGRWGRDRQLWLSDHWAIDKGCGWSSPSVREC